MDAKKLMDVILGCDPLLSPLTGIGNYTLQLGLGLSSSADIQSLRCFAHGRFFDNSILNRSEVEEVEQTPKQILGIIRTNLAKSSVVVSLYSKIMPFIEHAALRRYKDAIFHSPNFILPRYEGPKVVTIHDLSTLRFPQYHPAARVKLVNNSVQSVVENKAHVITDSEFIKSELCALYSVPKERVTAIHLGVAESFYPRDELTCLKVLSQYSLSYKQFFLFVSTIEPRKNVLRLLQAFKIYRQQNPNGMPLILIGGKGWNSQKEHALIQELSLRGWVKYLGFVRQSDLPLFYSAAKALLFPSLYEGFGLPVAEALQSGTQVMTSQDSAMSEFSQSLAVYVNPLDTCDIAEKILFLSESSHIISHPPKFPWSRTCEKTVGVYLKL